MRQWALGNKKKMQVCLIIFLPRLIIYKKQKGFGEHTNTIQSVFEIYGAAGKLTTHGSQHFHKQNALKAVAFCQPLRVRNCVLTRIYAHKFFYVQAVFLVLPF
jgi:hypothetical protein